MTQIETFVKTIVILSDYFQVITVSVFFSLFVAGMNDNVVKRQSLAELLKKDKYCQSMPLTKTSADSTDECQVICTMVPGCLFINVKQADFGRSVLCHYADPLNGQVVSTPDNVQGWTIYLLH